jgi:hypothetical protein
MPITLGTSYELKQTRRTGARQVGVAKMWKSNVKCRHEKT